MPEGPRPGTVTTVHNLAFQGRFDAALLAPFGLPPRAFTRDGVEYHGDIGFLKAGLALADRITTVSPSYAAEICTPQDGMGLDGLPALARRPAERDPERDRHADLGSGVRCADRRAL